MRRGEESRVAGAAVCLLVRVFFSGRWLDEIGAAEKAKHLAHTCQDAENRSGCFNGSDFAGKVTIQRACGGSGRVWLQSALAAQGK